MSRFRASVCTLQRRINWGGKPDKDGHQCANFGAQVELEVYHVVSTSSGGTNLTTVCQACISDHLKRTAMIPAIRQT